MMRKISIFLGGSLLIAWTASLQAQKVLTVAPSKNEVGLVVGATVAPSVGLQPGTSTELSFNPSLALGAEYDRYVFRHRRIAVSGGIDFLASPFDVKASNPPVNVSGQSAYIFLTPHVRVKFNPEGTFQPWVLFGGGYARFRPAQPVAGGPTVAGNNTGTYEFGGGVDTKPLIHLKAPLLGSLPIGARVEVRDFYSGTPNYGVPTRTNLQNTVAFTGGLLLHF